MSERRATFGAATVDAMRYAMREDQRVVVIGEDISWGGNFGQFRGLVDEFGSERVVDMPISEAIIMAVSVGAAVTGLRPVASMSFVEFTLGAMDEIVNQAAVIVLGPGSVLPVLIPIGHLDTNEYANDNYDKVYSDSGPILGLQMFSNASKKHRRLF